MSEEKIDSLDIQIETSLGSDTAKQISKASSAIKRMAENLKDVDTSRLEKLNSLFTGTKELESYAKSIKTVSASIKSLSKIDQSGLQNVKTVLKEISDMKMDFSQFKDLQNIDFSGLKKYSSQLDSIKKSVGKMDTVIPGTTAGDNPSFTLNGITRIRSEWDDFFAKENQNADTFNQKVSGMGDSRKVFYTDGEYQKYDTKKISQWVNADAEKSDKASQKAKEAQENWKKFTAGLEKIITPKINTDSLKQLEKEIASTSARYEKLTTDFRNRQLFGESIKSEPMKNLQVEIKKAEKMLDGMKAKYSELSSKAIMHEQGRVKNVGMPVVRSKDIDKLQFDLAKAQQNLRDLLAEKERLKNSSLGFNTSQLLENATAINATKQQIAALQSKIDDVNAGKLGKISTFSEIAKGALSKLTGGLKILGKGLKWVGGKALNLGKSMIASKTGANGLSGSLNGGYKAFLRYGLGIRSTFALLNKLRASFGNAMNNLVQYSSTTNRAVSSMWNSLNALKNSLATAFAPVINSVAPYVSALIDMLTDAMNTIAQFFAAITGSKTVVVAKKQNKNYAASLGNIGSAAGGSADKVKDLADALDLLDFDEINKLSDNTSNKGSGGSGGGSGSGGSGVAGMFETETVDSAFKDLADLFKNGDWDAIGDIIADGINSAVGKLDAAISWDNVGDKITNICNGITSIFNRVVDKMDWSMLGKTVGDGANTVVNTINLLYDGVSWGNLGSKMATGVNSIFTTVDWDAVGVFLVQKFNAVWEAGAGFFNNLDGKSIGNSIGTALNSEMKHLNLNSAKSALSGALNTLSDVLEGFNTTVDWGSMTEKLSSAIKGFFTDVNWEELAHNIGELAGSLIASIANVLTDIETWKAIAKALKDTVFGLFNGLFDGLFGKDNKVDVDATANVNTDPDGETGREKWKEQWGDGDTSVNADVKTNPNGREGWAAFNTDFTNEDGRRGGLHAGVSTSRTGGEVRKLLSQEWDKNNKDRFLANIEPLKTGDQLKKDTASLWDKTTISPLKIGVQGKLQNDLDTSGLGKVQVDASAKLNTYSNGLIDNKKPSIGTIARLNDHSNGLTGNNKPSIGTIARLNDSSNGLTGKSKPSVNVYGNIDKAGGQPDSKPKVNAKADFDHKDNYINPSKKYYPNIPAIAALQNAVKSSRSKKKTTKRRALGGVFSNGMWKNLPQFAGGGIITSQKIGRFAGGGLPSHGSLYVAGEKGSEIVGNINGRTEVLNQSQIASAIYAAMIQAMKQQNVNVDVSLQGDANTMFKVVQKKARQYTVQTGKMPFAY